MTTTRFSAGRSAQRLSWGASCSRRRHGCVVAMFDRGMARRMGIGMRFVFHNYLHTHA